MNLPSIETTSGFLSKSLHSVFTIQFFWTLLIIVFSAAVFLISPLDRNYTSGELLDQFHAFQKGYMYAPLEKAPYLIFNYPPLFHFLASGLNHLGLSLLTAGRLLNLLSFIGCALIVYQWLRKNKVGNFYNLATLSLIGTSYPLLTSLGQIQIQMTAVFFSLSGLFLLNFSKNYRGILLSGLLLTLACFTKQTQALTLVMAVLWCLFCRRKNCVPLLLSSLLTTILGIIVLQASYGAEIWRHLLTYTVGSFSFENLGKQFLGHLFPWIGLIILTVYGTVFTSDKRQKLKNLSGWYLISTTLGLFTSARLGSSAMYFVEWSWALLIFLGPLLPKIFSKKNMALNFLLLTQIILGDIGIALVLGYDAKQVREQSQKVQSICDKLPQTPQFLVSSHPGMLQACGHSMAFYPFITSSLMNNHLWNGVPLLQDLAAGKFPRILLEFQANTPLVGIHQKRWNLNLIDKIKENYFLKDKISPFIIYETNENF